jgi:hypothetical protein
MQQPQQHKIVRIVTTPYGRFGDLGLEAFGGKKKTGKVSERSRYGHMKEI